MKDNFYRDRLIVKISVYSVLYLLPLLFVAIVFGNDTGSLLDVQDYALKVFSEISLPFATFVVTAVILILDLVKRKMANHAFAIITFFISLVAFTAEILAFSVFTNLLDKEFFFFLEIGLVIAVWALWLVEFIMRKKKSAVKGEEKRDIT